MLRRVHNDGDVKKRNTPGMRKRCGNYKRENINAKYEQN
jgi:hypothetical protein